MRPLQLDRPVEFSVPRALTPSATVRRFVNISAVAQAAGQPELVAATT
jgi:hypothetical protein